MTFSIIIPVYKVEDYIEKCINSILQQTFSDFEVIFIDDGSPDGSADICVNYCKKDSRFKIFRKANGGSSTARNEGLKYASGDYVVFMDSDDYWCDNMLLSLLDKRIHTYKEEVVLFGCKNIEEDGTEDITRNNYNIELLNKHHKGDTLRYLVESGNVPGAAWIMAVKRDLLDRLSLQFEIGVTAEDFKWVITVLAGCNAIGAIEGVHYAYIKRSGSVTSASRVSGIKGTAQAIDTYSKLCKENRTVCELSPFVCRMYLLALMSYSGLPLSDKKEGENLLKMYLPFLKEEKPLYYYIVNVFGLNLTSKILKFAYNIVR